MYCILFTVLCTISLLQVSLFCTVTFAKESFSFSSHSVKIN